MRTLAILCLARHAGPTWTDLARDIAAVVRPGDHVICIDDSGPDSDDPALTTAARVARFIAEEGWGTGVAETTVLTRRAGADDLGSALNLALAALAMPGAMRDRVMVLAAGTRLDRAAFAAARDRAEAVDTDLAVVPWLEWSLDLRRPVEPSEAADWFARPGETATDHARRCAPPLQGLLIRAGLLEALWSTLPEAEARTAAPGPMRATPPEGADEGRADEGRATEGRANAGRANAGWADAGWADEGRGSHGDLVLVWYFLRAARDPIVLHGPVGHRPAPPDPGPELIRAAADLCHRCPEAAPWVADRLPRWLSGLTPGARAAILTLGTALVSGRPKTSGKPETPKATRVETPEETRMETREGLLSALALGRRSTAVAALPRPTGDPIAPSTMAAGAAPAFLRKRKIRLYTGPIEAGSSLFSNSALIPFWEDTAELVPEASAADLIVWSDPRDPAASASPAADAAVPQAVFCDDPAIVAGHSPDPLARLITVAGPGGDPLRLHQIAHHRSAVFSGGTLPYALLAAPDRRRALVLRLTANAALAPEDWRARGTAPAASMSAPPPLDGTNAHRPEGDLYGTRALQEALHQIRTGADTAPTPLPWHSALEAVHQPDHLSLRLFEAFAAGTWPLYAASPGHRLHGLGLPEGAWLNLWPVLAKTAPGDPPQLVAIRAMYDAEPSDDAVFKAYAEAQRLLAALLADTDGITRDMARLGAALRAELVRLVEIGPA